MNRVVAIEQEIVGPVKDLFERGENSYCETSTISLSSRAKQRF